ncbi:MAG: glycosyltransferase family 4 protein [Candidatus Methanomethylicia archaeon]
MKELNNHFKISYFTTFDIKSYVRPIFAKLALPNVRIFNYNEVLKYFLGKNSKSLWRINRLLGKLDNVVFRGNKALSSCFLDFVNNVLLRKVKTDVVISLNTMLASRRIWGECKVIVDWMDVWMTSKGEMDVTDVQVVEDADGVIFWSKPFMKLMTKLLKIKRFEYVPYGIDLINFDPIKFGSDVSFREKYFVKNKFILTYSGGFWRLKGIDLQGTDNMLEAFSKVSRRVSNVILVLQSFKIDMETLRLIKKLGIKDKILVVGYRPFNDFERMSLFKATDVFIAPSTKHPTGYYAERMKYFQYMAAGKAVLAERSPGAESVFGNTAYYVELSDSEAMADGILDLYSNKDLRENLGSEARKRVEELFEWRKLLPKYRNFIVSLISD